MSAQSPRIAHGMSVKIPATFVAMCLLSGLAMATASMLVFFYAPEERVMGFVQKIFYFHVPSAWVMFLAIAIACVSSIGFLAKKGDGWDRSATAATELALVAGALVLISGPVWGRKAWGAFWVWDVRLTATLVLVLTMVAAQIVRGYAGSNAKTLSSLLTILAVLNSVFVYYSVDLWRGTHPPRLVGTLEARMKFTLWFSTASFVLAFGTLFWMRLFVLRLESRVEEAYQEATRMGLHS